VGGRLLSAGPPYRKSSDAITSPALGHAVVAQNKAPPGLPAGWTCRTQPPAEDRLRNWLYARHHRGKLLTRCEWPVDRPCSWATVLKEAMTPLNGIARGAF
jgi:hypothetical protein